MTDFPAWLTGLMAVLLLTAFVKIFTVLSILRYGIGLGGGFGAVIFALSLALTVFAVSPQIESAGGLDALLGSASGATMQPALEKNFRPFVEKNTRAEILEKFVALAARKQATPAPADAGAPVPALQRPAFSVLVPAFLVSQLKEAFQLGFLILIPFLVIDLLVANALMLLDMKQLPQPVVALPFKILLFVAVDGWALVSSKVLGAYL
jgi:flagellar biosynthesis protein FliP